MITVRALLLSVLMRLQGIQNVVTYSALVSACGKGRMKKRALQLLDKMRQQGVLHNMITYKALIIACKIGNITEKALQLFDL